MNSFQIVVPLVMTLVASAVLSYAEETNTPAQLLSELKQECEKPNSPDKPGVESYLSPTERVRWRIMADLGKQKELALPIIRAEKGKSQGEYQQMLAVCLAVLGDADGVAESTNLLLNAKAPAVRVCAAKALRDAKDKNAMPALKSAMRDSYERQDGSCIRTGPDDDGMCFPVRIVAGDALGTLGLTREEINEMEKETAQPESGHVRK